MQNVRICILTLKTRKLGAHRRRTERERNTNSTLSKTYGKKRSLLVFWYTKNTTNDDFVEKPNFVFEEHRCHTTVLKGYRISTVYICLSTACTMFRFETHFSLTLPSYLCFGSSVRFCDQQRVCAQYLSWLWFMPYVCIERTDREHLVNEIIVFMFYGFRFKEKEYAEIAQVLWSARANLLTEWIWLTGARFQSELANYVTPNLSSLLGY